MGDEAISYSGKGLGYDLVIRDTSNRHWSPLPDESRITDDEPRLQYVKNYNINCLTNHFCCPSRVIASPHTMNTGRNRLNFIGSLARPGLCLLSSGLLIMAFPRAGLWPLAWVGLVPLFLLLDHCRPGRAFLWSYLAGILFFGGTLYWFIHVTVPGCLLLICYLALYYGFFGLGYVLFSRHGEMFKLFLYPSLWVVLEFARAHLLTGFGWAALAHSQAANLPLIQIADLTGAYGVSFLCVMVNYAVKLSYDYHFRHKIALKGKVVPSLALTGFFVVLTIGYGIFRLFAPASPFARAPVAVVQGNIPQEEKWLPGKWPGIMRRYLRLTTEAMAREPELIIWPETSFPGYIWDEPRRFEELKAFVDEQDVPLLLGTVILSGEQYFNSALLISRDGRIARRYDKLHLVPFGEYIPLRGVFPFLEDLIGIGDFTPGREWTLFPVFMDGPQDRQTQARFSVLICFEDTVAELSRAFVLRGAHCLVNITNDAWFQDTIAPFLHMQASLFRAVENRRELIRVANTGVTCFIGATGRVRAAVQGGGKRTYVEGVLQKDAGLFDRLSFYTKFGDVFTYLCFGCILGGIIIRKG